MTPNEAMKVIGLSAGSSQEELKKRFHTLAKVHHPDKGGNAETFKKISQANDVLKRGIPAGNTSSGFGSREGFDFRQATSWDWNTGEPIYDPPVTKKPPVRTTYTPPGNVNDVPFSKKTASQRMNEWQRHQENLRNQSRTANDAMREVQAEMEKKKAEFDHQMDQIINAQEEMMRRWRGY